MQVDILVAVVVFRLENAEPQLAANQQRYRGGGEGVVEFTANTEFEASLLLVMLETPENTGFSTECGAFNACDIVMDLGTEIEEHFVVARRRCSESVIFFAANGQVEIEEEVDHRGHSKTTANHQVADAVTAVFACVAVGFAPELVTETLQRKLELGRNIETGADF